MLSRVIDYLKIIYMGKDILPEKIRVSKLAQMIFYMQQVLLSKACLQPATAWAPIPPGNCCCGAGLYGRDGCGEVAQ